MRQPKKNALTDQICRSIIQSGPVSIAELKATFHQTHYNTLTSSVSQMKHYGILIEADGKYHLTHAALLHYGQPVPEELKPQAKETPISRFKEWSGKYNLANALRREPIREMSFCNGSTDFRSFVGYVI